MRVLTILSIFLLFSCSMFEENISEVSIARVEDKFLYQSDLEGIVPIETTEEDSALIVNNYIQGWVKDNLILQKAELNLREDQKNVQKQLEDYRKSLIIYAYEKELIKQRLDTSVSATEIQDFYDNNDQNFELKNDIVKVRYLKVNKNAPQIKNIRKLYKSKKEAEIACMRAILLRFFS